MLMINYMSLVLQRRLRDTCILTPHSLAHLIINYLFKHCISAWIRPKGELGQGCLRQAEDVYS